MHPKRRRKIKWSLEMKPGYEQGGMGICNVSFKYGPRT